MGPVPGPRLRSPSMPGRRGPAEEGPPRVVDQLCSSRAAQLLAALTLGPTRFGRLLRSQPGLSHKVLTENLRRLERDGLVVRTQTSGRPVAVDYALTTLGADLAGRLDLLRRWASQHDAEVRRARDTFDRPGEGAPVSPR